MKLRKPTINNTFLLSLSALILGTVLAFGLQIIFAWVGPTAQPPQSNISELLHTGPAAQEKTGPLTVWGFNSKGPASFQSSVSIAEDMTIEGKITGQMMPYFPDVWLTSVNRRASEFKAPFDRGCQWVSGSCNNVALNTDAEIPESEGDQKYYVVTAISGGQVYCCRPPLAPPPPEPFTMYVDFTNGKVPPQGVEYTSVCKGGNSYYQGIAYIQVKNSETNEPVGGIRIKGEWSGATNLCENGSSPCIATTASDGKVVIKSYSLPGTQVYGKSFTFTILSVKDPNGAGSLAAEGGFVPSNSQSSPSIPSPPPGVQPNIHVASIEIISAESGDDITYNIGYYRYAIAKVKIVNEVGIPMNGITVSGNWLSPYPEDTVTAVTGKAVTAPDGASQDFIAALAVETGVAKFITPAGVYCWRVAPTIGFKATGLSSENEEGELCPSYNASQNYCGGANCTGSISALNCPQPPIPGWYFGGSLGRNKWAWGENIGWAQFQPLGSIETAFLSTYCLEGRLWAENVGWINLGDGSPRGDDTNCSTSGYGYLNNSATDFGVNFDTTTGKLSGYAWGENIGWIKFNPSYGTGVYVDRDETTAKLKGYAWGENIGWIKFDYGLINNTDYTPWATAP